MVSESSLDRSLLKVIGIGGASPQGKGELAISRALELTGKSQPNVLIIPTPKRTQDGWDQTVPGTIDHFANLGLPTELLHSLDAYEPHAMEDRVGNADLVYTTGGDTLHMMETLDEFGITTSLGARALRGEVVLTGASAGAIMPTTWGHSDSLSYRPETADTWDYVRVNGLDLVPVAITPHYSNTHDRLGLRADKFKEMLAIHTDAATAIGLDNFASYVVTDGTLESYSPHPDNHVYVLERDNSGRVTSRVMESGESIELRTI